MEAVGEVDYMAGKWSAVLGVALAVGMVVTPRFASEAAAQGTKAPAPAMKLTLDEEQRRGAGKAGPAARCFFGSHSPVACATFLGNFWHIPIVPQ